MLSKKFPFPIVKDGLLLVCLFNCLCCYKLSRAIAKIEKEFANGHNVIIDTRRLTKSDRESLIKIISEKGYSDKIIWYHHKGE